MEAHVLFFRALYRGSSVCVCVGVPVRVCVHILGGKGVRPWPADSPRAAIVIDRRDALTICCLFFSLPFAVFCSFLMSI